MRTERLLRLPKQVEQNSDPAYNRWGTQLIRLATWRESRLDAEIARKRRPANSARRTSEASGMANDGERSRQVGDAPPARAVIDASCSGLTMLALLPRGSTGRRPTVKAILKVSSCKVECCQGNLTGPEDLSESGTIHLEGLEEQDVCLTNNDAESQFVVSPNGLAQLQEGGLQVSAGDH